MTKLSEMSYGELINHVDDLMWTLRIKSYEEGYEQGRSQEVRDKIVEQAKSDVRELEKRASDSHKLMSYKSSVKFVVNKEKRTVVALLRGRRSRYVHARGKAKCLPTDCFNVHIGKAIALRRALSLLIPDEYLNAPQPTEARVGDIIQYAPTFSYRVDTVCGNVFDLVCIENGESYGGWVSSPNEYKIIDDSREGVTE